MAKDKPNLNELIDYLDKSEHSLDLIPLYDYAIEECRKIHGDNHTDMLRLYNNFGGLLRDLGYYNQSEHILRKAIECAATVRGTTHPDYATSLGNLANLLRMKKEYTEAESLFLKALAIYKTTIGDNHFLNSGIHNNLALLYQGNGELNKAADYFNQGLSILKSNKEYKIPYAIALHNTVELHKQMNHLNLAKEALLEELSIYHELHFEETVLYAGALHALALLLYEQGDKTESIALLKRSLAITKERLGLESDSYLTCEKNLNMIQNQ